MDEHYIQYDFPLISVLIYIINWVAWYRVLNDFWLSLIIANIVYLSGIIIYVIFKK